MKNRFKLKAPIKVNVIAHNSKSYDIHFIIKYCLENNYKPKNILKKGTKILLMNIKSFYFIDSLSFLPLPLKSLPKAFGIPNICKGEFPHGFNKPENWYKVLDNLPDLKYYYPDQKTEKERNNLIRWYNENKTNKFDFREEIQKYCITDVDILLKSIMIFRDIWKNSFNIDCFTRNITLPQSVMELYKN